MSKSKSKSPEKAPESTSERKKDQIYIGHLSYHIRESDLKREFEQFGTIKTILLKNGFAFIVLGLSHILRLITNLKKLRRLSQR